MSLETDFLAMASTTVVVAALSTHTAYGAGVFSITSSTYPAHVEYGPKLIVGKDGRQEVAAGVIYVLSSSATIGVQDRLTMGASTTARLLRVDTLTDEEGQHHLEVYFG